MEFHNACLPCTLFHFVSLDMHAMQGYISLSYCRNYIVSSCLVCRMYERQLRPNSTVSSGHMAMSWLCWNKRSRKVAGQPSQCVVNRGDYCRSICGDKWRFHPMGKPNGLDLYFPRIWGFGGRLEFKFPGNRSGLDVFCLVYQWREHWNHWQRFPHVEVRFKIRIKSDRKHCKNKFRVSS